MSGSEFFAATLVVPPSVVSEEVSSSSSASTITFFGPLDTAELEGGSEGLLSVATTCVFAGKSVALFAFAAEGLSFFASVVVVFGPLYEEDGE